MWRLPDNILANFKIQRYIRSDTIIVSAAIGIGILYVWSTRHRRRKIRGKKTPTESMDRNMSTEDRKLEAAITARNAAVNEAETCAERYVLHQQYIENVVKPVIESQTEKKVIGLSCEWVINDMGKPISPVAARLHVCTYQNFSTIFEFCCKDHVPAVVRKLLEDPAFMKVGIDLLLLANEFNERFGLRMVSTLDLRFLSCFNNLLTEKIDDTLLIEHGGDVATRVDASVLAILLDGTGDQEYQAKDAREAIAVFTKIWKTNNTNSGPMYDAIKRFFDRQFGGGAESYKKDVEECGDAYSKLPTTTNSEKERALLEDSDKKPRLEKELIDLD